MSFAPWFALIAVLMTLIGSLNLGFFTLANAYLQVASDPAYRGRVVSVYMLAFGGMTPVGNLLAGFVVEAWGAATSFLILGLVLAGGAGCVHLVAWLGPTPTPDEALVTDET